MHQGIENEPTQQAARMAFMNPATAILPGLAGGRAGAQHKPRHLGDPVVAHAIVPQPLAVLTCLPQKPELLLLLLPPQGLLLLPRPCRCRSRGARWVFAACCAVCC